MFHRSLRPGGLLATEHTQKLPGELNVVFEQVAGYAQIFRRLDVIESIHKHVDGSHSSRAHAPQECRGFRVS